MHTGRRRVLATEKNQAVLPCRYMAASRVQAAMLTRRLQIQNTSMEFAPAA
jgi:hypothetical protein